MQEEDGEEQARRHNRRCPRRLAGKSRSQRQCCCTLVCPNYWALSRSLWVKRRVWVRLSLW